MIQGDLAQPVNLLDTVSQTFYYDAAKQLIAASGQNLINVPRASYWENLFGTTLAGITAQAIDNAYYSPSISQGSCSRTIPA